MRLIYVAWEEDHPTWCPCSHGCSDGKQQVLVESPRQLRPEYDAVAGCLIHVYVAGSHVLYVLNKEDRLECQS